MAKDEKQTLLKRMGIISKEAYIVGICLIAIVLIYTSYLYKYEANYLEDYLFALLKYFIAGIPLSYVLWTFTSGKGERKQVLLGLFAAYFVLVLAALEKASDYWYFVLLFWPLPTATCFLAIMAGKLKNRKHFLLSALPLALLIVAVGICVYHSGFLNLLIIPFGLIQLFCAAIYLVLALGDNDKVRIRTQRLLIVFCLLQTWSVYGELLNGYEMVRLFQQILILLWPIVVLLFFSLPEHVKGIGRLFICYILVFGGMWLLAEPYISDTGLGWEAVGAFYLLLTANVVVIMENHRRHQNSRKMLEYGVVALINAGYLAFFVWSSKRVKDILYDLLNENNWGGFHMEALRANMSGSQDEYIWKQLSALGLSLSGMNFDVGMWLPIIVIALTCLMTYFAGKSHCENETAELIKRYLYFAFLVRIVLSVSANLFIFAFSRIKFPLLLDGEADLAVMVMLFSCISVRQRDSVNIP